MQLVGAGLVLLSLGSDHSACSQRQAKAIQTPLFDSNNLLMTPAGGVYMVIA